MKRLSLTRTLASANGAPFTTRDLLRFLISNDSRFVSDEKGLQRAARIEEQLAGDERADFVDLESADLEVLADAASKPEPAVRPLHYPFQPAHKLLPMIEDIKGAPEVKRAAPALKEDAPS